MKKFGISDNIIIMDDDYFIGKKLKKRDFFYVQNRKIKQDLAYYKILAKINPILIL